MGYSYEKRNNWDRGRPLKKTREGIKNSVLLRNRGGGFETRRRNENKAIRRGIGTNGRRSYSVYRELQGACERKAVAKRVRAKTQGGDSINRRASIRKLPGPVIDDEKKVRGVSCMLKRQFTDTTLIR